MLQSEKGSKIMFLDPFGNQQFHPWKQDRFKKIAKILVICLRIILSTTLFLEGAQPRVALQPINPLIELNYITVLKNQQLKQKQVSKKFVKTKVSELSGTDKTDFEPGAVSQEKTNLFQLEIFSTSIECME